MFNGALFIYFIYLFTVFIVLFTSIQKFNRMLNTRGQTLLLLIGANDDIASKIVQDIWEHPHTTFAISQTFLEEERRALHSMASNKSFTSLIKYGILLHKILRFHIINLFQIRDKSQGSPAMRCRLWQYDMYPVNAQNKIAEK